MKHLNNSGGFGLDGEGGVCGGGYKDKQRINSGRRE